MLVYCILLKVPLRKGILYVFVRVLVLFAKNNRNLRIDTVQLLFTCKVKVAGIQTSSHEIHKSRGLVYSMVSMVDDGVLCIWELILKILITRKVYVVHLKLCVNYISILKI